jgi:hypothetical protein
MKLKTATDIELSKMLDKELYTINKYIDIFDCMTFDEKVMLREWLANGRSVNYNPCWRINDNGSLVDIIAAYRTSLLGGDVDIQNFVYRDISPYDDDEMPF